jgi:hypothetical protein
MIRWCPVATVLLLATCGGGTRSAPGPWSSTPEAPGTATTGPEVSGGLAAPDGEHLDRALSTTDLSLTAEDDGRSIELVATNQGPNPADDVWIEVGPASAVGPPAGVPCEAGPADLSCSVGAVMAREDVRLSITAPSGVTLTAEVTDRAGHDPDPRNNRVEVAAR